MADIITRCEVCGGRAKERTTSPSDYSHLRCETCGDYDIGEEGQEVLRQIRQGERMESRVFQVLKGRLHLLSGAIRERTLLDQRPVILSEESMISLVSAAPVDVVARMDRLLLNLSRTVTEAGETLQFDAETDYPLSYSRSSHELSYFIGNLWEAELLIPQQHTISMKGWERIREIRREISDHRQAFVAMSFSSDMDGIYSDGIVEGFNDTGYEPYRVDRDEHVERIDDKILIELDRSRFVVADFTGRRRGVYFEAGYALGQETPVIWTCRKSEIEKLHFDIRQYNMIDWGSVEDLAERLHNRILSVVG